MRCSSNNMLGSKPMLPNVKYMNLAAFDLNNRCQNLRVRLAVLELLQDRSTSMPTVATLSLYSFTSGPVLIYSYLSAATGSTLVARRAGM